MIVIKTKLLILTIMSLIFWGCNNELGHTVKFSQEMEIFSQTNEDNIYSDSSMKILVYYDSIGCFDCKIKEFLAWGNMIDYFCNVHPDCPLIFVFSASEDDSQSVYNYLQDLKFGYPIYFDKDGSFLKDNYFLLNDEFRGQNILLDAKDSILCRGQILREKKDLEKFEKIIISYE